MRFVDIFAPYLYAVSFNEEGDEFSNFIDFLTDTSQLEQYFNDNKSLLIYSGLSIEDAVNRLSELAIEIYDYLNANKENLDEVFEPISAVAGERVLYKMKFKKEWIRLYAIQIESKYYVITGGAIKQSQKMSDHPATENQLAKMEQIRIFLKNEGITDIDGLLELIME